MRREEAKIVKIEAASYQCQRLISRVSPFFKETAQSISSILSDQTKQILEEEHIATSTQIGQLIKKKLIDHPLMFSAPRDKLDRYHRVLNLVSTSQEVRDLGMLQMLSKAAEYLQ